MKKEIILNFTDFTKSTQLKNAIVPLENVLRSFHLIYIIS